MAESGGAIWWCSSPDWWMRSRPPPAVPTMAPSWRLATAGSFSLPTPPMPPSLGSAGSNGRHAGSSSRPRRDHRHRQKPAPERDNDRASLANWQVPWAGSRCGEASVHSCHASSMVFGSCSIVFSRWYSIANQPRDIELARGQPRWDQSICSGFVVCAVMSATSERVTDGAQPERHVAVDLHLRQIRWPAHVLWNGRRHMRQRRTRVHPCIVALLRLSRM